MTMIKRLHHNAYRCRDSGETRRFYEEYFAVSDLSADFYLETVRYVFQEHALARGWPMLKPEVPP